MPTGEVEFAKVSYSFAGGHVLLHELSLRIEAGTTTALLGRSGAGKTTLLRMINGLAKPSSGQVLVSGRDVAATDPVELRRGIGYVIQGSGLFPHMTVERNAGLALELAHRAKNEITSQTAGTLELVGLNFSEYRGRYPWQLSGGQKQRVGLARALAGQPDVLLMDEPFGALDPLARLELEAMLKDLLKRLRKTVLLVTHDLKEALALAERVVFLEQGKIVADLAAADVLCSENVHVKDYVAAVNHGYKA
ncbi:MAG: ATP-binding cassette domain-containing protein [Acidobacteriaceae bacterium]|nr:ATP-binding cassette domain-containing protein [Acidobacteriaceae bacterium]